ncbi:MAG TPA: ribonuclease HII [Methanomicrobiales archaeon]|nr:ribonuclease HII [Methanomicrobiales archaeon]
MICGVDEAGKGAVLGPLVVAGVSCGSDDDARAVGARDSKTLTPGRREEIYAEIVDRFRVATRIIPPERIDADRRVMSLNLCIARGHAAVVSELGPETAILDACDVDAGRYKRTVAAYLTRKCRVVSVHGADGIYPVVGAASIVAKVVRDRAIADLAALHGEIGSGYPSDPVTIAFLKEYLAARKVPPPFARASWATTRVLVNELHQTRIIDF